MKNKTRFVFFGTPSLVVPILEELKAGGFIPSLVITAPDKPKGRGLALTPPPAKIWAEQNKIEVLQPEKLDSEFCRRLSVAGCKLFIVVAYGKILPQEIIDLPEFGTYNVHYSLLPKYRGATPVESAILNGDEETGVSIQKMVFELDAGPVAAEEKISIGETETAPELRGRLNDIGKKLLVETIQKIISGTAKLREQDHKQATHTKKITKEDGLIDLSGSAEKNWRKYRAYYSWPGTYFFTERGDEKKRVIIKNASFENGVFVIKRVLPEGGKEMKYEDFLRG
ncbi:MAG: methionyl-tRNA formyltransferase [Patescibacteria group bacterium]